MTPSEALARQPAPESSEASESVTDLLLERRRMPPVVRALLVERREQGRAHYGTELETWNARDAACDLLQELVDALAYAQQLSAERPGSHRHARVVLLETLVLDVANELGVVVDETAPDGEDA